MFIAINLQLLWLVSGVGMLSFGKDVSVMAGAMVMSGIDDFLSVYPP